MPKKIIITTLIVLITIMFAVNLKASLIPKEISQNYIIYEDDNFFIESTTTIYFLNSPLSNDRSVSKNKSVQRTNTIKNKAGKTLASYTLSATFTYNGRTSSCTKTNYSTSTSNNAWYFSSATARKKDYIATGNFTLNKKKSTVKHTSTITISCDKNGNIQ